METPKTDEEKRELAEIRRRALSKLTTKERAALGLYEDIEDDDDEHLNRSI